MSILFLMEKLMKLVSTRTWKGGPSWVLYWKKRALELWTCSVVLNSFGSYFLLPLLWFIPFIVFQSWI